MKTRLSARFRRLVLTLALLTVVVASPVSAQEARKRATPGKAFAASLLLPGLGHRYAQEGSWRGRATLFAAADIGLWMGLFGANWQQQQRVQSYETLAVTHANALIDGKDRAFYLNLATYPSSDAYLEAQLRNRAWNRLDYVSTRDFQWEWASEADFQDYRSLRNDAETLGRRRSIYAALLLANRLFAGISAVVQAGKANAPDLSIALSPPADAKSPPGVHVTLKL
ncbi:MAG: hypothetical protein SH809_12370 [Rhodothermales bacterium]|nr:hypothetical protein [Rhodothermales bacterium]